MSAGSWRNRDGKLQAKNGDILHAAFAIVFQSLSVPTGRFSCIVLNFSLKSFSSLPFISSFFPSPSSVSPSTTVRGRNQIENLSISAANKRKIICLFFE